MKTNMRMVSTATTTGSPSSDKPVTMVIGRLSHAPMLSKGQVLVRGIYQHDATGKAEVRVSMDASAMARKMAARATDADAGVSTTGVDSVFHSF